MVAALPTLVVLAAGHGQRAWRCGQHYQRQRGHTAPAERGKGSHGNASSVHALVEQVVEPSITETSGVIRVELRPLT